MIKVIFSNLIQLFESQKYFFIELNKEIDCTFNRPRSKNFYRPRRSDKKEALIPIVRSNNCPNKISYMK